MTTMNLPPPQPFMTTDGTPNLKWEEWREYFLNYISTVEDESFNPEKKKKFYYIA